MQTTRLSGLHVTNGSSALLSTITTTVYSSNSILYDYQPQISQILFYPHPLHPRAFPAQTKRGRGNMYSDSSIKSRRLKKTVFFFSSRLANYSKQHNNPKNTPLRKTDRGKITGKKHKIQQQAKQWVRRNHNFYATLTARYLGKAVWSTAETMGASPGFTAIYS